MEWGLGADRLRPNVADLQAIGPNFEWAQGKTFGLAKKRPKIYVHPSFV